MIHKSFEVEIKADTNKRTIEAYASTFGNKDLGGDVVQKGAFAKTIQERFDQGRKNGIKVLWQHNMHMPIGLPIHMEEDSKGLLTVSKISNTDWGNRALELAKDRVVDKTSIGYDVIKDDYSTDGARLLQELKLYEYSLVTFPMNEAADVLGVKALGDMAQLTSLLDTVGAKDLTELLQDHQKAGAVLSSGNVAKIKNAITALTEVLSVAGVEPVKSATQQTGSELDSINPHDLQLILADVKRISF